VRHYTSRAGEPHRHLHLQINARSSPPVRGVGCTRSGSWTASRRSTESDTPQSSIPVGRLILSQRHRHHAPPITVSCTSVLPDLNMQQAGRFWAGVATSSTAGLGFMAPCRSLAGQPGWSRWSVARLVGGVSRRTSRAVLPRTRSSPNRVCKQVDASLILGANLGARPVAPTHTSADASNAAATRVIR
jgi:hypothetical protein